MPWIGVLPLHGFGCLVIGSDVAHEFAFQVMQEREDAPGDDVAFDLGEPELHVVQPGGVGRGTVQLYMRMGPQEGLDVGGLVRREIVEDHVNLLVARLMRHDVGKERDELSGGMACDRSPEHFTGLSVECRESERVPWRAYSKPCRSARPGDKDNTGSKRSSAWLAVFSSTQKIVACCGRGAWGVQAQPQHR